MNPTGDAAAASASSTLRPKSNFRDVFWNGQLPYFRKFLRPTTMKNDGWYAIFFIVVNTGSCLKPEPGLKEDASIHHVQLHPPDRESRHFKNRNAPSCFAATMN